jgi:hypothetical protein
VSTGIHRQCQKSYAAKSRALYGTYAAEGNLSLQAALRYSALLSQWGLDAYYVEACLHSGPASGSARMPLRRFPPQLGWRRRVSVANFRAALR